MVDHKRLFIKRSPQNKRVTQRPSSGEGRKQHVRVGKDMRGRRIGLQKVVC